MTRSSVVLVAGLTLWACRMHVEVYTDLAEEDIGVAADGVVWYPYVQISVHAPSHCMVSITAMVLGINGMMSTTHRTRSSRGGTAYLRRLVGPPHVCMCGCKYVACRCAGDVAGGVMHSRVTRPVDDRI